MNANAISPFQMGEFIVRDYTMRRPVTLPSAGEYGFALIPKVYITKDNPEKDCRFAVLTVTFNLIDGVQPKDANSDGAVISVLTAQAPFSGEKSNYDEDQFIEMVKKAGMATMIPIARAYMLNANTMFGLSSAMKIPNINVNLVDNWIEEKED